MYFAKLKLQQNTKKAIKISKLRLINGAYFRISLNNAFKRDSGRIRIIRKCFLQWGDGNCFCKNKIISV